MSNESNMYDMSEGSYYWEGKILRHTRGWWNHWVPNIQLKSEESYWELIRDVLVSKYFQIYENKFNFKKASFYFLFFSQEYYIYIHVYGWHYKRSRGRRRLYRKYSIFLLIYKWKG